MPFPASRDTTRNAFDGSMSAASRVRDEVKAIRDQSASGSVNRDRLIHLQQRLSSAISLWNTAKSVPGIVDYAKAQFNDPTVDIGAEFNGMVTAATTLRDWINSNFPRDAGSGAVLENSVDINGIRTALVFTSAQLATFRSEADAFLATIN